MSDKVDTGIIKIHDKDYKTVALRVKEFRKDHPKGRIKTKVVDRAKLILVKAKIYDGEGCLLGTGHAEEDRENGSINRTSGLENCETSAIGRALAACGYLGSEYATQDEIAEAKRLQEVERQDFLVNVATAIKEEKGSYFLFLITKYPDLWGQAFKSLNTKQKSTSRTLEQESVKQVLEYVENIQVAIKDEDEGKLIENLDEIDEYQKPQIWRRLEQSEKDYITQQMATEAVPTGEAA